MTIRAAGATLLSQVLASASAATAFTATLRTEVTRIFVANVTGGSVTFDLYHADEAQGYSAGCALFYQTTLEPNSTLDISSDEIGGGISLKRAGALGVGSNTDQAVAFSIYGVTEEVI